MSRELLETIVVGENTYRVIKNGRAQAEQVLALTSWFSRHGMKALTELSAEREGVTAASGVEFIGKMLDHLTADALIDLFQALITCTKEEAELHFDIALLIDVVAETYERQPAVKRLVERFFSQANSTVTTEESSTT